MERDEEKDDLYDYESKENGARIKIEVYGT